MKRGIYRYLGLAASVFIGSCGFELRQAPGNQVVDNASQALNLNIQGLDDSYESVYFRYKLDIQAYSSNALYSIILDEGGFDESHFSIVQEPCFKNCSLNFVYGNDVLPEISITCQPKPWISIETLNPFVSVPNSIAFEPTLDLSNNREAHLLWRESTGASAKIYSHYRGSDVWETLSQDNVISPIGLSSRYVDIASNDNGKAIAVWQGLNASNIYSVYTNFFDNDLGWSTISNLNFISPGQEHVFRPQVDFNNNDEALVVWTQRNSSNVNQVFFAQYFNGQWFLPSSVNDTSFALSSAESFATDVQIKLNDDGRALVSWRQLNHLNEWQVFYAERVNGLWFKPLNNADHVSPTGSHVTGAPVIDMNLDGDILLAWSQINFNENADRIFHATRTNGLWQFPLNINAFIPGGEGIISGKPSVTINDAGEAYVAWSQQRSGEFKVYLAYRDSSDVWDFPMSPSDYIDQNTNIDSSYQAQVLLNNEGNAILGWTSYQASVSNVYLAPLHKRQILNTENVYQLSNVTDSSAEDLDLTFNDQCQAIAVWTHKDSNQDRQVFVREMAEN